MKTIIIRLVVLVLLSFPTTSQAATYDISGNWGMSTVEEITYKNGNLTDFDIAMFSMVMAMARGEVLVFTQNGDRFSDDGGDDGYISGATYYYYPIPSSTQPLFGINVTGTQSATRITLSTENLGFLDFDIHLSFTDIYGNDFNGTFYCKYKMERFYTPAEYNAAKQSAQEANSKVAVIPLF